MSFSYKPDNDKAPESLRHHLDKQAQGTKSSLGNLKARSTYGDPLLTKELWESPMPPKAKGSWMNFCQYVIASTTDLCLTRYVVHNTKWCKQGKCNSNGDTEVMNFRFALLTFSKSIA